MNWKVTILERRRLSPSASFVACTSGAAMILVSLLTMGPFWAKLDECLSSSVQGFWCVVYRFYWTSVNPQLGYASSYSFNLFLRSRTLGLEQGGLGGIGLTAARGGLSDDLGFPCNLEQGEDRRQLVTSSAQCARPRHTGEVKCLRNMISNYDWQTTEGFRRWADLHKLTKYLFFLRGESGNRDASVGVTQTLGEDVSL